MRKTTTIAAVMVLVITGSGAAEGQAYFITGNDLYAKCTVREGSSTYYQDYAYCSSFIVGASDAYNFAGEILDAVAAPEAPFRFYCIPSSVNVGQLTDVTINYLRDNPAERHRAASLSVMNALAAAFPCPT